VLGAPGAGQDEEPARQGPRASAHQDLAGDDAEDALRRGEQDMGHVRDEDPQAAY